MALFWSGPGMHTLFADAAGSINMRQLSGGPYLHLCKGCSMLLGVVRLIPFAATAAAWNKHRRRTGHETVTVVALLQKSVDTCYLLPL